MLDLNDVQIFVRVVENGGFSAAARSLGRPKSSISSRIARLEDYLGARLIQRTSRRFAITGVGREFYRHATAMVIEAAAAEDAVRLRASVPAGAVRLSSSIGTSQAGLAHVLSHFSSTFPKVVVHLQTTNRAVDIIEEGFDMVVRAHDRPLADSDLIQRQLGVSRRWLVAAPAYLAERGRPQDAGALADHHALSISDVDGPYWKLVGANGSVSSVQPLRRFSSNDLAALRVAARIGLGIAALPVGLCHADVASGRLERVTPAFYVGGAHISILTAHRRGQLPSVRALSDFIAEQLPVEMMLEPQ